MKTWPLVTGLLPILVAGCATGFDRVALEERLNDGSIQMPEAAIADVRAIRPQLRLPCKVAVYFKPGTHGDWRWTHEDRAALDPCIAALKREGIAADVFPIPEMLLGKGDAKADLKDLRLAAARCGADALLVIQGAAQTDSYKNPAAVLYLTVVGGYVVPGSHKDSLFLMEGCLIDVDNGYVYAGLRTEGVGKIVRPTFLVEEKDSIALAKKKAVGEFGEHLLARLRTLAHGVPATGTVPAAATYR